MNKGIFITIEGNEGSGKTTISKMLESSLSNFNIVFTREPGGIAIAEQIRLVILNSENKNMDPRTEVLLFAAARRQHLVEKIIPALENGKNIICDRFIDSSFAYQSYGRGLEFKDILDVNNFATDNKMPDLTIYLDIDPEIGLKRKHTTDDINRIDMET